MNRFKTFALLVALSMTMLGCAPAGTSEPRLMGTEQGLPPELKGMQVYRVSTGGGNLIYVATLPDRDALSLHYQEGKYSENVVVLQGRNGESRTINASKILFENDEMIVLKK